MATMTAVTDETTAALEKVGNGFPPLTDHKQPGELGDEQLAQVVSNGLVNLAVVSERLKPYFFELRERFHRKSVEAEIHGCRTWDEFCKKVLKRTRRAVNYLLSGGNPASKRTSHGTGTGQQNNGETSSTENGKPSFAIAHSPIDGDVTWSKQDASRRMLSWNVSCLKPFSPAEKREVAEDLIAKLRDEIEFEATPQPPPIAGDPVPEPEPGTLEELRQRIFRMADVEDIGDTVKKYLADLVAPLLQQHPLGALSHSVSAYVSRSNKSRVAPGDWVMYVKDGYSKRLRELIGEGITLGRVVGVDELRRPKIRWHDGKEWKKPYSFYPNDGDVRVLFDWQAAELQPRAFGTYPSDPEPPNQPIPAKSSVASADAANDEKKTEVMEVREAEEAPKPKAKRAAKSKAKPQEPPEDITVATPHGYYAKRNRKPKGATQEAQPWEIFLSIDGAEPKFCCREPNRQDAEACCWKLDRMAEEEKKSTPTTTNNEAAEAAAM